MNQRISETIFSAERVFPFLFGICVAAIYDNEAKIQGTVLKVHVIGLGISSFSSSHKTGRQRFDRVLVFFPLLLSASIVCFKKFRQNTLYFGGTALAQMIGMRLLVTATIGLKKRSFHWDESGVLFRDASLIQLRLQNLESLLKHFAYPEDQHDAQQMLDQHKEKLCEIFSLEPSLYEQTECIGKSISDPTLKISALTTLGVNDPSRANALFNYCNGLRVENFQLLDTLRFEAEKFGVSQGEQKILIPPCSIDQTDVSFESWEKIRTLFERIISTNCSFTIGVDRGESRVTVNFENGDKIERTIPYPVRIVGNCENFVIDLKNKKVGKGGERSVSMAYGLITGEYYAVSGIHNIEAVAYNALSTPPNRGLPLVSIAGEETAGRQSVYLPLFDYNLSRALSEGVLANRQSKLFVIRQLLQAVSNFHKHQFEGLNYTVPADPYSLFSQTTSSPIPPFPAMHGDIKPQNIVIMGKTKEVMLIDLGVSCLVTGISGTLLYLDPSSAAGFKAKSGFGPMPYLNQPNIEEIERFIKFSRTYGQKRDVWATGLVVASILVGLARSGLPNLSFLTECTKIMRYPGLMSFQSDEELVRMNVAELKQNKVDSCLQGIGRGSDPLIPLLRSMLQVDVDRRITMKQALEQFDQIVT